MSKFFTSIPVDLDTVKKLLPENSFLERVTWNPQACRLEIHWDHGPFYTGRDFATEFDAKDLAERRLPEGTKKLAHGCRPPAARNGSQRSASPTSVPTPAKKANASKKLAGVKAETT